MDIIWLLINDSYDPITGGSAKTEVRIRQYFTGYVYDWETLSFASSASSAYTVLEEETLFPGLYHKEVDISDWDDGRYFIYCAYDDAVSRTIIEEKFIYNGEEITEYEDYVLFKSIESKLNTLASNAAPSAAALLSQEYYSGQDLDGDTLIFGVDFYISVDCPEMLIDIPTNGAPKTWTEYQAEHPELF
jgi:hypothetical protein